MLIGTSAIVSTFRTGGKRKKKKKKEDIAFPFEDTFWNLHVTSAYILHWPEFNYTAQPSYLKNLRTIFYSIW